MHKCAPPIACAVSLDASSDQLFKAEWDGWMDGLARATAVGGGGVDWAIRGFRARG